MNAILVFAFLAGRLTPVLAQTSDYPLPPPPAVSSDTTELNFSSDHLDYSSATALIHLQGHAVINESSWTLKADDVWINPETHRGTTPGFFIVQDTVSAVAGNAGGFFDFDSHQAVVNQAASGEGDWRIHARQGVLRADRSLEYYHADFTSCDRYPNPHYDIYASRLTVVPNRYLLAYNCVFYLGPAPLFYSPVIYKSLKPVEDNELFQYRGQPGYDNRNGYFIDNTIISHWNKALYTKAYVDYYNHQGVGTGGEIDDHERNGSRGTIYGYQIGEHTSPDFSPSTGRERWVFLGQRYQLLPDGFSFHSSVQALSDPLFNNDYARSSPYPFTSELNNSAAFSYAASSYTASLSYSRVDLSNAAQTGFQKVSESAPRLDVHSKSFTILDLPWLNTISAFEDNTFAKGQGYIQRSGGGSWQGTRSLNLIRGVTLRPSVTYSATYYNKYFIPFNNAVYNFTAPSTILYTNTPLNNSPLYTDALINRYTMSNDLRWQSPFGYWDGIHTMIFRSRPGGLGVATTDPDYGLEENLIMLQDAFRPAPKLWASIGSGYNLQQLAGFNLVFHQRLQPITGDLSYSPKLFESFDLRDQFVAGVGNQSLVADAQFGDPKGFFIGGGAGYNLLLADQYYTDTRFGWISPGGNWHFVGSLYSGFHTPGGISQANRFAIFDKELQVVKLFHDFTVKSGFMWRPDGAKLVHISVSLRLGHSPEAAAQALRENYWESEWYPQRQTDISPAR